MHLGDRIKASREAAGLSQEDLGRKVGVGQTTVGSWERGRTEPKRVMVIRIAKALDVPLADIEGVAETAAPEPRADQRLILQFLPVRYRVRAGLWEEIGSEEPIDDYDYAVAPNPRFGAFTQWLELVVGDSANLLIPDKHLAHVVDAQEMGYAPQHEDVVVVERRRDGGGTRERTIKQVEITPDGEIQLWPRSTNPKWSSPIDFADGARNGEEIEAIVVGLVIGSYNPTLLKRR